VSLLHDGRVQASDNAGCRGPLVTAAGGQKFGRERKAEQCMHQSLSAGLALWLIFVLEPWVVTQRSLNNLDYPGPSTSFPDSIRTARNKH